MKDFPRASRLLNGADFSRVFERAGKSADGLFTVLWRANDRGTARLGLAISKKTLRRAVDRNRVKRLIRESFRHHRQQLPEIDLVVLGRRGLAGAGRRQITRSLEYHWQRIARRQERPAGPSR